MWSSAVLAIDEVTEGYEAISPIEVRDNDGFKGVFAREDIVEDSVVFVLKGTISERPTRYTIELGRDKHLNFPVVRKANDDLDYCWQFLNHSCQPNGFMNTADLTFRALRNIRRGEEITFNYLTTESDMAVPFNCICGAADCFGLIQGNNHLSSSQRDRVVLIPLSAGVIAYARGAKQELGLR